MNLNIVANMIIQEKHLINDLLGMENMAKETRFLKTQSEFCKMIDVERRKVSFLSVQNVKSWIEFFLCMNTGGIQRFVRATCNDKSLWNPRK